MWSTSKIFEDSCIFSPFISPFQSSHTQDSALFHMDIKCMTSSSSLTPKTHIKIAKITPKCAIVYQRKDTICFKFRMYDVNFFFLYFFPLQILYMNMIINLFITFFPFLGLVLAAKDTLVVANGSKRRQNHGGLKEFM